MLVRSQKGIVHLGLLILLLLGLVAGVYLVQQQQIFRPKAAGGKVWLIDASGNNLPEKDGGVYEVPGQEIRIFIHQPTVWSPPRPQVRLPNLVTEAYAQSSQCDGNIYSCSDIKCPDNSTAPGTGCYEKGGDLNNRYRTECLRNCPASSTTGGTGSSRTTTNTGTITDASTPKITGSVTWGAGNIIVIPGQDFGSGGTVYYSPGSQQTVFPNDQVSWSSSSIRVNTDRIPECAAAKTVDCLIKGGYVKVCRTDSKCSDFAQIPDRTIESGSPQGAVRIPNVSKGEVQPEVTEVTQEIRISSVVDYVKKDGACEGNADPAKHCMRFTADNPDSGYTFAALLTKGYVGWLLANTTEEQNVSVGFISNKGKNFVESIKVRIVRPQPTVRPSPSPSPSASPGIFSKPQLEAASNLTCIDGQAFYDYPQKGADAPAVPGYSCSCTVDSKVILVDLKGQTILTKSSCDAPPVAPAKTPCVKKWVGECVKGSDNRSSYVNVSGYICTGIDESSKYYCPPEFPICLTDVSCKLDTSSPSVKPSPPAPPAPPPPAVALPITGKVKITANGTQYNKVVVYYYDDNSQKKEVQVRLDTLPTNQKQEGSYTTEPMRRNQTPVWPAVFMSDGDNRSNSTEVDCPERPMPGQSVYRDYGCWVAKGSTQDFSITLPVPASQVSLGPLLGSPENPDPGMIYVKNNKDQQITVQKVEQLTSEPTFSFWFFQVGAGYTQLNSQPISIDPKKYVSFEAMVVACSRSDMESSKEKEVKVNYTIDTDVDSTTGIVVSHEAKGKYQCGGYGIVNIP